MIPLSIEIKNFLSYGAPVQRIEFKDYALICLEGKNGHGKSALLDAMTWALWGQARKIIGASRADEGLLRLGEKTMLVTFTCRANGRTYRVRRELSKTPSKLQIALDVELYDDGAERFISLTGKTIRETQDRIDHELGIDYTTFVNSAFLRQGHSGEFSGKNPKERKSILASILGLQRYDRYKQHALECMRERDEQRRVLLGVSASAQEELAREQHCGDQRRLLEQQREECDARVVQLEADLRAVAQECAGIERARERDRSLIERSTALAGQIEQQKELFRDMVARWRVVHHQRCATPTRDALEQEHAVARAAEETLRRAQEKSLALQARLLTAQDAVRTLTHQRRAALERACAQAAIELERTSGMHQGILSALADQEKSAAGFAAQRDVGMQSMKLYTENRARYGALLEENERQEALYTRRREYYGLLQQRDTWYEARRADEQKRLTALAAVSEVNCPVCDQLLTYKRRQFLEQQTKKVLANLEHRLNRIRTLRHALREVLQQQHAERAVRERESQNLAQVIKQQEELVSRGQICAEQYAHAAGQIARLRAEKESLELAIAEQREQVEIERGRIEATILADPEVRAAQQILAQIEAEQAALGYDAIAHTVLRERVMMLEKRMQEQSVLHEKLQQQAVHRLRSREAAAAIRAYGRERVLIEEERRALAAQYAAEPELARRRAHLEAERQAAMAARDAIVREIGSVDQQMQYLSTLKVKQQERAAQIEACAQDIEEYTALAAAFGKDGVQALLIEEALPQIEDEANAILARLTDNRAHICIESLRDLKNGGVKETLDIRIADNAGVRPYEMFSGGEAFRIDFALRIAISKLLARRAGTTLQTLIIDEGFGSQDEEGLSRMMDAIYAIREDFARVIVVSHLPVFKENFPVHMVVEKTLIGSRVTIVERG